MFKILTIIGTRPQIIKSTIISTEFRRFKHVKEIVVDTGQHYDYKMSNIFYEELKLRKPDINLNVGSGCHAFQLSQMIQKIDNVVKEILPDLMIVYGDTNSTVSAAIVGNRNKIKICHVEAGVRSFNKSMPEEVNRILTDQISDYLFVPTNNAKLNLIKEGIKKNKIKNFGDVLLDTTKKYLPNVNSKSFLRSFNLSEFNYILMTIHREENINENKFIQILDSIFKIQLKEKVVFSLHPRTRKFLNDKKMNISQFKNVSFIEPLGYLDMLCAIKNSKIVITDSGGVQREAFFMKKFSIVVREETEWVEIVKQRYSVLSKPSNIQFLYEQVQDKLQISNNLLFGDGKASQKIANFIQKLYLI